MNFDNFEDLFKKNGVEYSKIEGKSGLIFCTDDGEEIKITPEHINELFMFDYYYNLKPKQAIDTNDRTHTTINNLRDTLKRFQNIEKSDTSFTSETFELLAA
jgi:hypothetical protein|nr:MAG TPA: hypothetical protein [Caudoviricetes sp.]